MDSSQIDAAMKAYIAWDADDSDNGSTVVFAKTAREAKKIAHSTDTCENAEFINIRVKRLPKMDRYYRGVYEADLDNPEDRKALISLGWTCFETSWECETCSGKAVCRHWEGYEQ